MSELIEFGEMTFADAAREEYSEWVCPVDDDKRQKTVAFVSDTPESVLQQIEAKALESRAEDRQRSEMSPPLGEGTRDRIKELGGFEGNNTTFSWRSAKGVFTREGIPESRFNEMLSALADYDDPVEGAEAEIARLREADAQRGANSLSGDGSMGEEDIQADRRAADQARTVQGEGCDHARGHCENGDPEACEFLQNACGYDEEEARELLASEAGPEGTGATADGGEEDTDFGLETPGGDGSESGEEGAEAADKGEITGKAAGALSRSWGGYQGALSELGDAVDHVREAWQDAQGAARAINAIRADHGQDPIHFEALEAANADLLDLLRKMAADCEECHADHSGHEHAVDAGALEDAREVVREGAPGTPVGVSESTAAAIEPAPEYHPEHIPEDGERIEGEYEPDHPSGESPPERDPAEVPEAPSEEFQRAPVAPSDERISRQSIRGTHSEADERAQQRHQRRMEAIAEADATQDAVTVDGNVVPEQLAGYTIAENTDGLIEWRGQDGGTPPATIDRDGWATHVTVLNHGGRYEHRWTTRVKFDDGEGSKTQVLRSYKRRYTDGPEVARSRNRRKAIEKAQEWMEENPAAAAADTSEEIIETNDQQTLGGDRADPQARLAGGETGDVETEIEQPTEQNPGGLRADQREEPGGETETTQARPDAFQVPEDGQTTL